MNLGCVNQTIEAYQDNWSIANLTYKHLTGKQYSVLSCPQNILVTSQYKKKSSLKSPELLKTSNALNAQYQLKSLISEHS